MNASNIKEGSMSAYENKLLLEKKSELSKKVSLSLVNDIVEMSLMVDTAEEFVEYLLTIDDKDAIEEFFNKCHDQGGRFCGGSGGGGTVGGKNGTGPRRGPGTRIPAPIDYLKTTVKSAWKVSQARRKSQKLKSVTGPLLGVTGPYGVRVGRLQKADISKFSQKDLSLIKTRLEANQRKYNVEHTQAVVKTGLSAGVLAYGLGLAATGTGVVISVNPAAAAGIGYAYGVARWKTKHIPKQINRVNRELSRRKSSKVAASLEDALTFQDDVEEDNLPTLEQEIAAARKEIEGLNISEISKPSQSDIKNVCDFLAEAMEDEDMPDEGKAAISKMMAQ